MLRTYSNPDPHRALILICEVLIVQQYFSYNVLIWYALSLSEELERTKARMDMLEGIL
jgi:hypothetical protein